MKYWLHTSRTHGLSEGCLYTANSIKGDLRMNDVNRASLPLDTNLLAVADALVEAGNLEALHALRGALTKLILGEMTNASLVEINEYVTEAVTLLEGGKAPEEIKVATIRELIDKEE